MRWLISLTDIYRAGHRFLFNLYTTGLGAYDVYAGVLFPDASLVTVAYPAQVNAPNVSIPWKTVVTFNGVDDFPILDLEVPQDLMPGAYQSCGLMTIAGSETWDSTHWQSVHCAGFVLE